MYICTCIYLSECLATMADQKVILEGSKLLRQLNLYINSIVKLLTQNYINFLILGTKFLQKKKFTVFPHPYPRFQSSIQTVKTICAPFKYLLTKKKKEARSQKSSHCHHYIQC